MNTYTGVTQVQAGTLLLTGTLANTATSVLDGATFQVNGAAGGSVDVSGILGGIGTINNAVAIHSGGSLVGTLTIHGPLSVDSGGLMDLSGGTLTATSGVTNNWVIRLARGASLAVSGGAFVNSGVLDVITGSFTPPTGGFVNNGVVLDSSAVRAQSASYQPSSQTFTVQIDGYPGHIYRLQKSATLTSGFASAGVPDQPVAGNSGASAPTLTFTDNYQSAAQGFYRVVVDP